MSQNIQKILVIAAVALCLTIAAWAQESELPAEAVEVQGEVVELSCYLDHGGHGDSHAGCAKRCLEAGAPAGLLTSDGELYLLTRSRGDVNADVKDFAGEEIVVVGRLLERNGLQALQVESVSPVKGVR